MPQTTHPPSTPMSSKSSETKSNHSKKSWNPFARRMPLPKPHLSPSTSQSSRHLNSHLIFQQRLSLQSQSRRPPSNATPVPLGTLLRLNSPTAHTAFCIMQTTVHSPSANQSLVQSINMSSTALLEPSSSKNSDHAQANCSHHLIKTQYPNSLQVHNTMTIDMIKYTPTPCSEGTYIPQDYEE